MNYEVKKILAESSPNGKFDDLIFIKEQKKLTDEERFKVRFSPEIVESYFKIKGVEKISSDYPYWDTTTLSFKKPLLDLVREKNSVLEMGCGPAATMTVFLCLNKKNIQATAVDINNDFINTAKTISKINKIKITFIHSEMFNKVKGEFDILFTNPPYVPTKKLTPYITENKAHQKAASGGESGFFVIDSFLTESVFHLKDGGLILLGVQNKHLKDEGVKKHIRESGLKLVREYYDESEIFPKGPMSQIYILKK